MGQVLWHTAQLTGDGWRPAPGPHIDQLLVFFFALLYHVIQNIHYIYVCSKTDLVREMTPNPAATSRQNPMDGM